MKRVIVIGCPGAGKSTFARKLAAKTGLPLHYLRDFDKTIVRFHSREETDKFIESLK